MAGLNSWSLNSIPVNSSGSPVVIVATGSGVIVSVEQVVGLIGSGNLIQIEQDVQLFVTGSGTILSIEQATYSVGTGNIIQFSQNVQDLDNNTYYNRNGYDVEISIGGNILQKSQICDEIEIIRNTGESVSCRFAILASAGVQDIEQYQGKAVYVNIIKSGVSYRQFFGYVDLPEIDLIDEKIIFNCTDRRINSINRLSSNVVSSIGSYSIDVFGTPVDKYDELSKRMQTLASDFDFDKDGVYRITPWTPKSTADFTLSGSDIYYDKPRVTYENRSSKINTITFDVTYTFQRLHQQSVTLSWPGYSSLTSWYGQGLPSFPSKEMIENAARVGNWRPTTSITHTDLWEAQGFEYGGNTIIWQPNDVQHEYAQRTKVIWVEQLGGGTQKLEVPVYDINGNKIYDLVKTTITDKSSYLSRGATWRSAIKFAQNVTETYSITMSSPQAVTRFGIVSDGERVDIIDEYDTSVWEDSDSGVYNANYNFFVNAKPGLQRLFNVFQTMLNKTRKRILAAHRDVVVSFSRSIWPEIDLHHTVATTATRVTCKGKVDGIRHVINVRTGEARTYVNLRLSRAESGDTDSDWAILIPQSEDSSYVGSVPTITLGTHVGEDPDTAVNADADTWNGFVGNKNKTETLNGNNIVTYRTQFVESFRVDYPAIADALRKTKYLSADYTFNVAVPNDTLTIEF